MITGIKRASTAAESKRKYFLTRELITGHFRRESDKQEIKKLLQGGKQILVNYLNAATAIHVYHYLGIHTKDTTHLQSVAVESFGKIEDIEKGDLYGEINQLLKDSVDHELNIFLKGYKFQSDLAKILYGRKKKEEQLLEEIRDDIEDDLVEIIRKLPLVYFYDYVGDLTGYNRDIETEILEQAMELKATALEIERELKAEDEDKFIEISKLFTVQYRLQRDFEFSSFKALELETIPMKMIITKILNHNVNSFPISQRAIRAYIEANQTITKIFNKFKDANEQPVSIDEFEVEVKSLIKDELAEHSAKGANHFIYYLENLLSLEFHDLVELLEKYGITNVPAFIDAMRIPLDKVKKLMSLYGVSDLDIKSLSNTRQNLISRAKLILERLKMERRSKGIEYRVLAGINLEHIDSPTDVEEKQIYDTICQELNQTPAEIKKFIKKNQILREKILPKLGIQSLSHIVTALGMEHILENLAKDIYFSILGKICRQLARILECFIKIKEDKTRILVAFKRIFETKESEKWVAVKLEDLIINRFMKRQGEIVTIFSTFNEPFIVNGFILARLTDKTMQEAIQELQEEESPIYSSVVSLTLPKDIFSPRSYVLAYDLLKRFELHEQFRRLKVEEAISKKEEKEEKLKQEIKQKQEANTFNWIERKITTSLMRITSGSINPNQLYWSDKDTKMAGEALKRHCELEGVYICPTCGEELKEGNNCKEHGDAAKQANQIDLFAQFYKFCQDKIKSLWDRTREMTFEDIKTGFVSDYARDAMQSRLRKIPSDEEILEMIDGERLEVAQKIAKKIGKLLDGALYKKFRAHLRNQRQ